MQWREWFKRLVVRPQRWLVWILAVFAIGAGGYFAVPALVPDRLVKAQIDEQIGRWTGGGFRLRSDANIAVEPGFRVIVSDPALVSVADSNAPPVVTAESIVAPLRILPLLIGKVEIAELVLLRPDIDLRAPAGHLPVNAFPFEHSDTSAGQRRPLGEVILVEGTVHLDGVQNVAGLDLRLATDPASEAVGIQGDVTLGDRHVRVDVQLDDLRALISEAGTQGRVNAWVGPRLDSDQDDVNRSDDGAPYQITEQLREVAAAVGLSRLGFGTITTEGVFSVTPQAVAISDATFSVGSMEMQGHLHVGAADGSVITRVLDLPDAVGTAITRAAELNGHQWGDIPVTMAMFDGLDLDVQVSGDDLSLGNLTLDTAVMSFAISDGNARFDLAGARAGLGDLHAAVALEKTTNNQIGLAVSGRVDDMSVGKITRVLTAIGPPPLIGTAQLPEGTMNSTFDVDARGNTLGQLISSLNGTVTAQLKDGSLAGTDLVATLETLVQGREFMTEEHGPLIPAAGRTRFDQLDARLDFASGTANVAGIHIAGERFGIDMLGEVQLTEGIMNVGGNAVLLSSPETESAPIDTLVDLPFGVGGTVFSPVVAAGVPTVTTAQANTYAADR